MRALTYHGTRDVRVDTVSDPRIERPTDAIIRVTSSGICGSDLHLYEVLDVTQFDNGDLPEAVREMTDGRGPISVIDAVGMEAHGAPVGKLAHRIAGMLPDAIATCGAGSTTSCRTGIAAR